MSFSEYFDLLLCVAQQVDQEKDINADVALSIPVDQDAVVKKSSQVKFGDLNTLYAFPQVQKNIQNIKTMSCQIDSFNPITSDVFAFDIEGLHDNGCNGVHGTNGDMICSDMVVIGREASEARFSQFC